MLPPSNHRTSYIDIEADTVNNGYSCNSTENQPLLIQHEISLEKVLENRDVAIRNVQASLFQIGDIYRELSTLVSAQHSYIDHIETNVEVTTGLTNAAKDHLEMASRRRTRRSSVGCCGGIIPLLISVIIVLLIIIIVSA